MREQILYQVILSTCERNKASVRSKAMCSGKTKAIVLVVFAVFLTTVLPGSVLAQPTPSNSKQIQSRLDSYITPYFEQKDFSGVIMIARNDSILAQKVLGLANVGNNTKNKIDTKFRIASLSKAFTAAAIVILIEKGRLKLTDPISTFFPDFPNGQNITVEHLLRHQSGIGELDEPRHYRNCYSAKQLVEEIGKLKALFPPGTDNSYSNEGYNLLAAIIENVAGESYERFLQKNVFQPLKMHDSGSFCSESKLNNLAAGYSTGPVAKTVEKLPFSEFAQLGSGSIYSTAPDLHKWLKAINENRLFQIDKLPYPFGWGKREYSGNKLIEQSGLVEGFNGYMALYPQDKLFVIFLSNIQSGLFNRVPKDLKAVAFGGEFSRPLMLSNAAIASDKIDEYVGEYRTPDIPLPLKVVLKKRNLYIKWGNYPFTRSLTPVSKDHFFHRAEYVDITFERDKVGQIYRIKWQAEAGEAVFLKKSPAND